MSLFVQDVFAEAKALGLTDGFVGTYADLKAALHDATYDPDEDGSLAWARYVEGGWDATGQYQAEEEADRACNPFDPQAGYAGAGVLTAAGYTPIFTAENDPDGEAENAWHEAQGERWAEAKASTWFAFPGDRH